MTNYTKVGDATTTYTKTGDSSSSYTKVSDIQTQYKSFGGLIYLVTEGSRDIITNEDSSTYIVVSKGVENDTYTKVGDSTTNYTKVIDA